MQKIDNVDARQFGQKKRPEDYEVLRRVIAPEIQATKVVGFRKILAQ